MKAVSKSIIKKVSTISQVGVKPYNEGKKNYEENILCVELLAKERANECLQCKYFVKEPIQILRVKDERIPELNEMMCSECGCSSAYKLRQSIEKCTKWKK